MKSRGQRMFVTSPAAQALIAIFGSATVATAWYVTKTPFGGLVAFVLLLLPLVNAPFEICLAFVVLSQFRIPEVFPVLYPLRIPELAGFATLGALAWHLLATKRIRPFWSIELTFFALFFAHVTLCAAFAANRLIALEFWTSFYVKVGIMTVATAWLCTRPRQFAIAVRAFVAAGLAVGSVALWNKWHGIGLVEGGRVTIGRDLGSMLGDPNELALTLLFPAAFAMGLAVTRDVSALSRLFGAVTSVVVCLAIIATQSRGGLLGLIAVSLPFLRMRVRSPLLLGGIAAGGLLVLFAVAGISERATAVASETGIDESAMGRLLAWEAAIRMALADPLTGVGLHNFPGNFYFYTERWIGKAMAAHSVWFEILGENGFPGLLLFIAMIGVTAGRLLRASRRLHEQNGPTAARLMSVSLLAGICGFVVSGTFLSQGYTWPIYMNLAFGIAVVRYASAGEWMPVAGAIPPADVAPAGDPAAPTDRSTV